MLTVNAIRPLVIPGRYGDGANLWFQVRSATRRSWLFRYSLAGKAHETGLGSYPDVSLAQAREVARGYRELLRQGIDPMGHRAQRPL